MSDEVEKLRASASDIRREAEAEIFEEEKRKLIEAEKEKILLKRKHWLFPWRLRFVRVDEPASEKEEVKRVLNAKGWEMFPISAFGFSGSGENLAHGYTYFVRRKRHDRR